MKTIRISLKIFLFFTLLTGVAYPLLITGISQVFFPSKANGSLIFKDNIAIGSKLIGQEFNNAEYFTSRPSVVSYNPLPSGGSNFSMTNTKLKNLVAERRRQFITFNQLDSLTLIPSEMLFASGSGLDPHISQKAALLQVDRVARVRDFNTIQKQNLVQCVKDLTETPQYRIFGEERVIVLVLNLELNKLDQKITNN
jgi:K+-transporting ATPase ATPase C chain